MTFQRVFGLLCDVQLSAAAVFWQQADRRQCWIKSIQYNHHCWCNAHGRSGQVHATTIILKSIGVFVEHKGSAVENSDTLFTLFNRWVFVNFWWGKCSTQGLCRYRPFLVEDEIMKHSIGTTESTHMTFDEWYLTPSAVCTSNIKHSHGSWGALCIHVFRYSILDTSIETWRWIITKWNLNVDILPLNI